MVKEVHEVTDSIVVFPSFPLCVVIVIPTAGVSPGTVVPRRIIVLLPVVLPPVPLSVSVVVRHGDRQRKSEGAWWVANPERDSHLTQTNMGGHGKSHSFSRPGAQLTELA